MSDLFDLFDTVVIEQPAPKVVEKPKSKRITKKERAAVDKTSSTVPQSADTSFQQHEPADYTPDLTPVEHIADLDVHLKRDDLWSIAGVRGGKVRTLYHLALEHKEAGKPGLVTCGSRLSPQCNLVAHVAKYLGLPSRGHTTQGEWLPEIAQAAALGMEIVQHDMGYTNVINKRAKDDAEKSGWGLIPFGMECDFAVQENRRQVQNLPLDKIRRIVVPLGSGMCVAGILWGLRDAGSSIPVLGVKCGGDVSQRIARWAPEGWQEQLTMVDAAQPYKEHVKHPYIGPIQVDSIYEGKCLPFIEAGDLFWLVGIHPTEVQLAETEDRSRLSALALSYTNELRMEDGLPPILVGVDTAIEGDDHTVAAVVEHGQVRAYHASTTPPATLFEFAEQQADEDEEDDEQKLDTDQQVALEELERQVVERQPLNQLTSIFDLGDSSDVDVEAQVIAPTLVYDVEHIVEQAFQFWRAKGFPEWNYPPHVSMQEINALAMTSAESLLRSTEAYHVADSYHPHRYEGMAEGMKSPWQAFHNDKLLRRSIRISIERNAFVPHDKPWPLLSLVSGTQACSNFRPGFACYMYRRYGKPGMTVLDTSTGYGGRLVGYMASRLNGLYIGIDPNTKTHQGNLRMAEELGFANQVELINLPAEDVPHELVAERCDFAFTSPPYFRKEHYSEEDTQSWKRYPEAEQWRDGFLYAMMRLQFAALKRDAYAIVNIADVKIKGKVWPLVDWCIEAGRAAGFEYLRTDKFMLSSRFGSNQVEGTAFEAVIVFRKTA